MTDIRLSFCLRRRCRQVVADPLRREVQADGRIRFWGRIPETGEARRDICGL